MRIYTNSRVIDEQVIHNALESEKKAGRIAPHVIFKTLSSHRSNRFDRAFEIQLEALERDNGRRAGNSGSYGAMRPEYDGYAATFDEWGWLLNALYEMDPYLVVGSPKSPIYRNREDFDEKTGLTYNYSEMLSMLRYEEEEGWEDADPYPFVLGRGSMRGRYGAGRHSEFSGRFRYYSQAEKDNAVEAYYAGKRQGNNYVKFLPRSLNAYEKFCHTTEGALI